MKASVWMSFLFARMGGDSFSLTCRRSLSMESAIKGIGDASNKPQKGADDNRRTACEVAFVRQMHCLPICENVKMKNEKRKEWRNVMKRYFDDPRDNVAFERCVNVLAELITGCGEEM